MSKKCTSKTQPCSSCKLRLYFTSVETKYGDTLMLCKYCLPQFTSRCLFCARECFCDQICRQCFETTENPPAKEVQVFVDQQKQHCSACKKTILLKSRSGVAQGHRRYFSIVDRQRRPICGKCKPFEQQRTMCLTCREHFASKNALFRHLRAMEQHQMPKSECVEQWAVLKRLQNPFSFHER